MMSPATRAGVTVRSCRVAMATTSVHSGVVAFRIPAVDELTCCSPSANSRYGAALPNSAATDMCAHSAGERGSGLRAAAAMTNSTAAPRISRPNVTSTGDRPCSASLIQRKLEPQMSARSARRAVAEVCTRPTG